MRVVNAIHSHRLQLLLLRPPLTLAYLEGINERVGVKVVRMTRCHPHPPLRVGLSRWRERRNLYMLSMAIACNCSYFVPLSRWRERVGVRVVNAIHSHRLQLLLHCRHTGHPWP